MKTTIFGAGAVGGHLAARLGAAGADVSAVCRGAQLAAIQERGITLHTEDECYHARIRATDRPEKPYPEFPLFPHATRRWAKKIRGKMHYFGPWDDPDAALALYKAQADDLHAGRTPRAGTAEGLTVRRLLNLFLTAKQRRVPLAIGPPVIERVSTSRCGDASSGSCASPVAVT